MEGVQVVGNSQCSVAFREQYSLFFKFVCPMEKNKNTCQDIRGSRPLQSLQR